MPNKPLSQALAGEHLQIVSLEAGSSRLERLRGMGFGRGRILLVLKAMRSGTLLLSFEGSGQRVALAPEIAAEIQVRPWQIEMEQA